MQPGTVKRIIEIENLILAEQEHLRHEIDFRLQKLREEADQSYRQRRQQLQQEHLESLDRIRKSAEREQTALLQKAEELAWCLDALSDEALKRCLVSHLNLLLPGVDNDRQDGQS